MCCVCVYLCASSTGISTFLCSWNSTNVKVCCFSGCLSPSFCSAGYCACRWGVKPERNPKEPKSPKPAHKLTDLSPQTQLAQPDVHTTSCEPSLGCLNRNKNQISCVTSWPHSSVSLPSLSHTSRELQHGPPWPKRRGQKDKSHVTKQPPPAGTALLVPTGFSTSVPAPSNGFGDTVL